MFHTIYPADMICSAKRNVIQYENFRTAEIHRSNSRSRSEHIVSKIYRIHISHSQREYIVFTLLSVLNIVTDACGGGVQSAECRVMENFRTAEIHRSNSRSRSEHIVSKIYRIHISHSRSEYIVFTIKSENFRAIGEEINHSLATSN